VTQLPNSLRWVLPGAAGLVSGTSSIAQVGSGSEQSAASLACDGELAELCYLGHRTLCDSASDPLALGELGSGTAGERARRDGLAELAVVPREYRRAARKLMTCSTHPIVSFGSARTPLVVLAARSTLVWVQRGWALCLWRSSLGSERHLAPLLHSSNAACAAFPDPYPAYPAPDWPRAISGPPLAGLHGWHGSEPARDAANRRSARQFGCGAHSLRFSPPRPSRSANEGRVWKNVPAETGCLAAPALAPGRL
jgi:hypothetical protein